MGRSETLSYLREIKTRLRDDILALCSDKVRARQLFDQMEAIDISIDHLPVEAPALKYGRYKRAIDAVEALLKERGRPVEREEIAAELASGGFRAGKEDAATSVRKSLGYFLENEQGIDQKKIREIHGLVGLWGWPVEKPY